MSVGWGPFDFPQDSLGTGPYTGSERPDSRLRRRSSFDFPQDERGASLRTGPSTSLRVSGESVSGQALG